MDVIKYSIDLEFDNLNLGNQICQQQGSSSPIVSATATQIPNPATLSLTSPSPSNSDSSATEQQQPQQQESNENNTSDIDNHLIPLEPSFNRNRTHDLTFVLPSNLSTTVTTTTNSNNNSSSNSNNIEIDLENEEEILLHKIYAHKSKIQERSDYFRMLLTNGMRETNQQEISIPNVPVDVFFEILMFLYTSNLKIHNDSLNQIFLVCDQFLLEDGKQICRDFIKTLESEVLEKFLFDENLAICSELNNLYIEQAVCNSSYFLQLSRVSKLSKDMLIRILRSNNVFFKEISIFKAAMVWIRSNVKGGYELPENSSTLSEIFHLIRFPMMEYEEIVTVVEPLGIVPESLLLEAYRHLSKPKLYPLEVKSLSNIRLQPREKPVPAPTPGVDVFTIGCPDHPNCSSVSWTITNFSSIKTQKHVSNIFEILGLKWRMWAYPAGEAKHSDSFSVYLEAIRVKEKESYDFLRNTTFFFALVNQKNKTLSKHYPSSPNVLFNYEKSVWGNGLIDLKILYDPSLGYLDNDSVCIQLHILECIAIEG